MLVSTNGRWFGAQWFGIRIGVPLSNKPKPTINQIVDVISTHLKNMFVKSDLFPKVRGEQKQIFKTTLLVKPPPI